MRNWISWKVLGKRVYWIGIICDWKKNTVISLRKWRHGVAVTSYRRIGTIPINTTLAYVTGAIWSWPKVARIPTSVQPPGLRDPIKLKWCGDAVVLERKIKIQFQLYRIRTLRKRDLNFFYSYELAAFIGYFNESRHLFQSSLVVDFSGVAARLPASVHIHCAFTIMWNRSRS